MRELFVVATGDAFNGLALTGTFGSHDEAITWAEINARADTWNVVEVETPAESWEWNAEEEEEDQETENRLKKQEKIMTAEEILGGIDPALFRQQRAWLDEMERKLETEGIRKEAEFAAGLGNLLNAIADWLTDEKGSPDALLAEPPE